MKNPKILSSGDLAHFLGCAPRTACNFAEKGLLKCHRLPGSKDRRFYLEDVLTFAREHDFMTDELMQHALSLGVDAGNGVLLVACDFLLEHLGKLTPITKAADSFQAGLALAKIHFRLAVIDGQIGTTEVTEICCWAIKHRPEMRLIVLENEDGTGGAVGVGGVTRMRKPLAAEQVGGKVLEILEERKLPAKNSKRLPEDQ